MRRYGGEKEAWTRAAFWITSLLSFYPSCCLFPSMSKFQSVSQHAVMFLRQQPWIIDFQPRIPGHLQLGLHFLSQLHRHLPGAAWTGWPWLPEQTGLYFAGGKHLWLQALQLHHHHPWERGLVLLQASRQWTWGGPENPSTAAVRDTSLNELPVPAFLAVFPLSSLLTPCYRCFLPVGRGLLWSGLTVGFRSANQADGTTVRRGPPTGCSRVFERYMALSMNKTLLCITVCIYYVLLILLCIYYVLLIVAF